MEKEIYSAIFFCEIIISFVFVGAMCRERKIFFHTDAAQAIGKLPLDVNEMKIDLMSISGHKLYGPKGRTAGHLPGNIHSIFKFTLSSSMKMY